MQSVVLYGSETWTMGKVDSDRIQSFHMQALRRILGIRWYDKVSNAVVNERTKLPDLPSLIADRRHSLFGHICRLRLPENTPMLRRHCNCQLKPTLALLPPLTGSVHRVVHEEHDCNKWKKTSACLFVLPRSQAKIVRCRGRYDPQLVKRNT